YNTMHNLEQIIRFHSHQSNLPDSRRTRQVHPQTQLHVRTSHIDRTTSPRRDTPGRQQNPDDLRERGHQTRVHLHHTKIQRETSNSQRPVHLQHPRSRNGGMVLVHHRKTSLGSTSRRHRCRKDHDPQHFSHVHQAQRNDRLHRRHVGAPTTSRELAMLSSQRRRLRPHRSI